MIKNHLALILGQRLGDSNSAVPTYLPISKPSLELAKSTLLGPCMVTSSSGWTKRFQLEKAIKTLHWVPEQSECF